MSIWSMMDASARRTENRISPKNQLGQRAAQKSCGTALAASSKSKMDPFSLFLCEIDAGGTKRRLERSEGSRVLRGKQPVGGVGRGKQVRGDFCLGGHTQTERADGRRDGATDSHDSRVNFGSLPLRELYQHLHVRIRRARSVQNSSVASIWIWFNV